MSRSEPQWLVEMRSLVGVHFALGGVGNRDVIHHWLDFIASQYHDMREYCQNEKRVEYFPWCGLTVAYCMARSGVRPVFGATEKQKFLWAAAWLQWGVEVPPSHRGGWSPEPGDVVVFDFGHGGEHVTLFVRELDNGRWECLGGNQGHAVQLSSFSSRQVKGVRRPGTAMRTGADDGEPDDRDERGRESPWSRYERSQFDNDEGQPMVGLTSDVIAAAQKAQAKWGVPASITLAQFILESGAGRHMPAGSNNPFGIKARGDQPYVVAWTWEEKNGKRFQIQDRFRKFASFEEAFDFHGELIGSGRPYREAMKHCDDPDAFADKLTGVYATASNYGSRLKDIMKRYNLRRYDRSEPMETQLPPGWNPWSENWRTWEDVLSGRDEGLLTLGSRGAQVRALQDALIGLGYWLGEPDSEFGPLTQQALMAFQRDNNIDSDGEAGPQTWAALKSARPRSLPKDRTAKDADDLRNMGSRILTQSNRTWWAGLASIVLGLLGVGNSIAVNAGGGPASTKLPANLETILANLGNVKQVIDKLPQGKPLSADDLRTLAANIDPTLRALNENIGPLIKHVSEFNASPQMHSVLDFLLSGISSPTGQSILSNLSSVVGSVVPGFGGSLLALGLGFAARHFSKQITNARVEDYRLGKNIGR